MKKLAAKFRSKSFWVTLAGAAALILSRAGIDMSALVEKIINAIGGVLLVFGIAVSPAENNEKEETDEKQDKGEEKTKL